MYSDLEFCNVFEVLVLFCYNVGCTGTLVRAVMRIVVCVCVCVTAVWVCCVYQAVREDGLWPVEHSRTPLEGGCMSMATCLPNISPAKMVHSLWNSLKMVAVAVNTTLGISN